MELRVVDDADALARAAADLIGSVITEMPDALILAATGETPMGTYAELAARHRAGRLDTAAIRVAQLDEYAGVPPDDRRSLFAWTRRAVCVPLAVDDARTIRLVADGPHLDAACRSYDARISAAGGIDLAVLGLGPNGHLGFNEPPTDVDAPTRPVALSAESLASNARYWDGLAVPRQAITAGMATIMAARRIVLLVAGATKAGILARLLASAPDRWLPASWLHRHPDATVLADRAAMPGAAVADA